MHDERELLDRGFMDIAWLGVWTWTLFRVPRRKTGFVEGRWVIRLLPTRGNDGWSLPTT